MREDIIGFHALVAVFGAEFQKVFNIQVPHIQRNGDGAFAFALLVDGNGRVIDDANPRNNAAGGIFDAFDAGAFSSDTRDVDPDAATKFGNGGNLVNHIKNRIAIIIHHGDEARAQIAVRATQVHQQRRAQRDFAVGQFQISIFNLRHADGFVFVLFNQQSNA